MKFDRFHIREKLRHNSNAKLNISVRFTDSHSLSIVLSESLKIH